MEADRNTTTTPDAADVMAAARRVLTTVPYGFITTVGETRPSVRMVGQLGIDEDLRVTFATGRHTRKAAELRADPTAVYAAADLASGAAVCLYGTARVDDDPNLRRSAWRPELATYFPAGPEGAELVIVTLEPDRVEVWSKRDRIPADQGLASAVLLRSPTGWTGGHTTLVGA